MLAALGTRRIASEKTTRRELVIAMQTVATRSLTIAGSMGIFAALYSSLSFIARLQMWVGIQTMTRAAMKSARGVIVSAIAVYPTRTGIPPDIPPRMMLSQLLLLSQSE